MIPKFRAWHVHEQVMCEVIRIDFKLGIVTLDLEPDDDEYYWTETDWNISHVILMQSTGLKDKNGVEIYEGDVVNVTQYFGGHSFGQLPHVVKVSKYSNVLILYALSKQNYVEEYTLYFSEIKDYEVIGNIYENPERLEAHT